MTYVMFLGITIAFHNSMGKKYENPFVFKGEVVEILNDQTSVNVCVKYEPGIIMMELPKKSSFQLGDEILISGNMNCKKIENIDYLNTNNKSELL